MAKDVLPRLNQSVRAKGLFLVASSEKTEENPAAGPVLVHTGPEPVAEDLCRRLVEHFRAEAVDQPVVRNGFHQSPEGQQFNGCHGAR